MNKQHRVAVKKVMNFLFYGINTMTMGDLRLFEEVVGEKLTNAFIDEIKKRQEDKRSQ